MTLIGDIKVRSKLSISPSDPLQGSHSSDQASNLRFKQKLSTNYSRLAIGVTHINGILTGYEWDIDGILTDIMDGYRGCP